MFENTQTGLIDIATVVFRWSYHFVQSSIRQRGRAGGRHRHETADRHAERYDDRYQQAASTHRIIPPRAAANARPVEKHPHEAHPQTAGVRKQWATALLR